MREGAEQAYEAKNQVPPVMYNRLLSLRGFDDAGMMVDAEIAQGADIQEAILRLFENNQIAHIDAHNAAQGCFSGRITRG